MRYRLRVTQPNKVFTVRGKPTRTPFTVDNVTETELKVFQSKIKLESIPESAYEIISMDEVKRMEQSEKTVEESSSNKNVSSSKKSKNIKSTSTKSKSSKSSSASSGSKKSKSKSKNTLDLYAEDEE